MADNDKYDLEGFAIETEENLVKFADSVSLVFAEKSTQYAPQGYSGQLKRSIKPIKAFIEGGKIFAGARSFAAAGDPSPYFDNWKVKPAFLDPPGYNYALKQHDEKLNHFQPKGKLTRGFQDAGKTGSKENKYWQGYFDPKTKKYRYATKFFEHGFNDTMPFIDKGLKQV